MLIHSGTTQDAVGTRDAIVTHTAGARSVQGSMTCHVCAQPIRYSIAPNGHVWARCSTAGCVAFME